jgi:hypothetical protein
MHFGVCRGVPSNINAYHIPCSTFQRCLRTDDNQPKAVTVAASDAGGSGIDSNRLLLQARPQQAQQQLQLAHMAATFTWHQQLQHQQQQQLAKQSG